jgi:hypothetical protein
MIFREDIEKVYPGAANSSDGMIEIYIDMTEGMISSCLPDDKKEIAQLLLISHYLYKASVGTANGEVTEIDNGSMKKKFGQSKDSNLKSIDPYSSTQYGQAYLDMVTVYCGGVFFAGAGSDCYY